MEISNDKLIREVEINILDKYKEKFEYYFWPDVFTVPMLFKSWSLFAGVLKKKEKEESSMTLIAELNMSIQGLGWCIKWAADKERIKKIPKLSANFFLKKGIDYIQWGKTYHILAQNHIAYSRNLIAFRVDTAKKEIIFLEPAIEALQFNLMQEYNLYESDNELMGQFPHNSVLKYYFERVKNQDFKEFPKSYDWSKAKDSEVFKLMLNWAKNLILPELGDSTEFIGYSLGDIRQFFASLYLNSILVTWYEDEMEQVMHSRKIVNSFPIVLQRKEIETLLISISGLRRQTINDIIIDFTYDIKNFHSSLTNQPFVKLKNGSVLISPRLITHINLNRTVLGALNKSKQKSIYDFLINQIEEKNILDLTLLFDPLKYKLCIEKKFKKNGKKINPDIIVYDELNNDILIIEYKNFLNPLNANEVLFKMEEVKKGLKQLEKYLQFFENERELLMSQFDKLKQKPTVIGILLCKWPVPIPYTDQETFVFSINQFQKVLSQSITKRLINNIKDFRLNFFNEFNHRKLNLRTEKISIKVEDWTYTRTIYVA